MLSVENGAKLSAGPNHTIFTAVKLSIQSGQTSGRSGKASSGQLNHCPSRPPTPASSGNSSERSRDFVQKCRTEIARVGEDRPLLVLQRSARERWSSTVLKPMFAAHEERHGSHERSHVRQARAKLSAAGMAEMENRSQADNIRSVLSRWNLCSDLKDVHPRQPPCTTYVPVFNSESARLCFLLRTQYQQL